ncbi:putative integral membrane protein, partial [Streptomyces sparsogenes DSM 40356]
MGIESEQLVYDYLSRVGDLAQQGGLPSGDRMRLVAELRADIDRRRASAGTDSPAGVKRILAKL